VQLVVKDLAFFFIEIEYVFEVWWVLRSNLVCFYRVARIVASNPHTPVLFDFCNPGCKSL
jgi:hypothetical protein